MKIFIHSCHACLERDHAQMLTEMGHSVIGQFDIGSVQRSKLKGVTDRNSDCKGADLILLHQCDKFPEIAQGYVNDGFPVILNAFGQGNHQQHEKMAELTRIHSDVKVVAYSVKDFNIYQELNADVTMIRFGDWPDQYEAWLGDWPVCMIMSNSIHRRGDACGWEILSMLVAEGLPIVLTGQDTQELPFGLGVVPWDLLRQMMRRARCMLNLGTVPAPYLMSIVQGMMAGMPMVAYDNGYGIAGEGFGSIEIVKRVNRLAGAIKERVDTSLGSTILNSQEVRKEALSTFGIATIKRQWEAVLNECMC